MSGVKLICSRSIFLPTRDESKLRKSRDWSRYSRRGEGTIVIDFTLTLTHFLTDLSKTLKVYEIKILTTNCRIHTVRESWKPIGKNFKPKVMRKHIILVPRASILLVTWSLKRGLLGSANPEGEERASVDKSDYEEVEKRTESRLEFRRKLDCKLV